VTISLPFNGINSNLEEEKTVDKDACLKMNTPQNRPRGETEVTQTDQSDKDLSII